MKIRKIIPVVVISTLGCAGLVLLTLQPLQKSTTYTKDKITSSISASAAFGDFDFTEYTSHNQKKYTLKGRRLGSGNKKFGPFIIASAKVVRIKDAEMVFYENNHAVSTVTAKDAVINVPFRKDNTIITLAGNIEFSGDVGMVTEDKRALTCGALEWNNSSGRLLASGNCKLRLEGKSVRTDEIDTDVQLKDFNIKTDSKKRLRALTRIVI